MARTPAEGTDPGMSESLTTIIGRLRFVSSAAPVVYLNESLVNELFIANLGAIASFTRAADTRLKAGVAKIVSLGGERGHQDEVEYNVDDSFTRALVLYEALRTDNRVKRPTSETSIGAFVETTAQVYGPGF